jgi:hypothetical protein
MQEQPQDQPPLQPPQPQQPFIPPQPNIPTLTPTPQYTQPATAVIPGKVMGIVGFIFAFVGLQVPGLILSIISFNKAKKAGFKNALSLWGIILNSIFIVLAIILIPVIAATTLTGYSGISVKANTLAAAKSAVSVQKSAEFYNATNGMYPTTTAQLQSTAVTFASSDLIAQPSIPNTIVFYSCGAVGDKIGYWDYKSATAVYVFNGSATLESSCIVAQ